jgi:methionyl aminopeptidase
MDQQRARITKDGIRIYEDADFAGMRLAGRVAAEILDAWWRRWCRLGSRPSVIDDFITRRDQASGRHFGHHRLQGLQARLLHFGEPCGLPRDSRAKVLVDGDILNIDVTVIVDGWYRRHQPDVCGRNWPARPNG